MVNNEGILIIGLGQIGYHDAEYFTQIGLRVDGYDIDEKATKRALDSGVISSVANDFRGYDHYIVAISTHKPGDMFQPYLDGLAKIAEKIREEGKRGALVAIESTISPGSSKNFLDLIDHKLHVAHVPHRFFIKEKEKHGVKQLRVVAGCQPCCTSQALHLYGDILNIPVYPVSDVIYAELSKVLENSHRYLEIAFAEELKIFCDEYGLSFGELRDAVNTKWNENVLEAQSGIGGHCLPKDSEMYLGLANPIIKESLLRTAKLIDLEYRRHIDQNRDKLLLNREQADETLLEEQVETKKRLLSTKN